MSHTIYKYTAHVEDELSIEVPFGAEFLHVAAHGATNLDFWFIVNPNQRPVQRYFAVRGTGHPLGDVGPFLGTVVADPFVWHVFEAAL